MKLYFDAFRMAVAMYSVLPCPFVWNEKAKRLVLPFFVALGFIFGGLWYGVAAALRWCNVPVPLSAVVLAATPLLLSGCIHLDGYMDTCDAIFSRRELSKKREILKDSHVGAFAVIGLVLLVLAEYACFQSFLPKGRSALCLLCIPVVSRSISAFLLLSVPPISKAGSGAGFAAGTDSRQKAAVAALGLAAAALLLLMQGAAGGIVLAVQLIFGLGAAAFCISDLKGISGDLCGFIQTVAELGAMVALANL